MMPNSLPSSIVCFGDSLTAGYQSPTSQNSGGQETPYGLFLQERLGPAVQVRVSGICGELTAEMAMRFRRDVLAHRPNYVVILGGTNDLGWNGEPADVMRNLLKLYESALAAQVTPVLVTIPSIRVDTGAGGPDAFRWAEDHVKRREELNGLIKRYAGSKALSCVDLFAETAEPGTKWLAEEYSNDGLHFTTLGYRRFAELLFDRVFAPVFGRSQGPIP